MVIRTNLFVFNNDKDTNRNKIGHQITSKIFIMLCYLNHWMKLTISTTTLSVSL